MVWLFSDPVFQGELPPIWSLGKVAGFGTCALIYLVLHHSFLRDRAMQNFKCHDISSGMATTWYNCLKKTVPDANEEARIGNPGLRKSWESFEAYKEKLRKNGVYKNGFLTDKQVILCPLLGRCREQLDQFIRSNPEAGNPLLKYCGLTAGICAFDNAVVKVGRRQEPTVHHLPDPISFCYNISNSSRPFEFCVVRFSLNVGDYYIRVIDNRTMEAMRQWYDDNKDELTHFDLDRECRRFHATLEKLLDENPDTRNQYYILPITSILSDELTKLVKMIERDEQKSAV